MEELVRTFDVYDDAAEYTVTPLAEIASDINDSGRVLFEDEIAIPNASNVKALSINNSGQIAGYYSSPLKSSGSEDRRFGAGCD